jgi:hypothetical protein
MSCVGTTVPGQAIIDKIEGLFQMKRRVIQRVVMVRLTHATIALCVRMHGTTMICTEKQSNYAHGDSANTCEDVHVHT